MNKPIRKPRRTNRPPHLTVIPGGRPDRWAAFSLVELEELHAAVRSRLEVAKLYATEEFMTHALEQLAEELEESFEIRSRQQEIPF